ncbi:carbohydrate ABC transporter permease [Streptomyces sp. NPDC001811]
MAQAAAVATPPAPPRRRRASATPRRLPYLLIAPAALLMLGFIAYPVLSVFSYSLRNYNPTKPWRDGFAGLDNFTQAFAHDPQFWDTLTFSAQWVVVEVGLQLLFGLALALIVNQSFVGRALGRALVFSPWAVSGVLTSAIWVLLYNSQTGITRYLADAGIGSYGTSWLSDTSTVFPAAVVADLWRGVPFFAILVLADLQSVNRDLYEAAEVDGAGRLKRFWHITLPHLKDEWKEAPVTAADNHVNGAPTDLVAVHNAQVPGEILRSGAGWTPVLRTRVDRPRAVPGLVDHRAGAGHLR